MGLFGRLDWEGCWKTVLCSPAFFRHVVLHPIQNRVITVRESARAQGFPDSFKFLGSWADQYKQVGNAVPPPLARALGRELKKVLIQKEKQGKLRNYIKCETTSARSVASNNGEDIKSASEIAKNHLESCLDKEDKTLLNKEDNAQASEGKPKTQKENQPDNFEELISDKAMKRKGNSPKQTRPIKKLKKE